MTDVTVVVGAGGIGQAIAITFAREGADVAVQYHEDREGAEYTAREVERLAGRPERHRTGDSMSARNRFSGVVTSVEVDGVMALVEIEAGPHRITAAITRDAVEELGLAPGKPATAAVKATSVMVEADGGGSA